jgi:GNAT superfamily N-acetyltransferase
VHDTCTAAWFGVSAHRGRFAAVAGTYRGLLDRIGERACFALATDRGEPAGVGLGVVDGAFMGVFSMLTVPEARRCGVGRAVLSGLAQTALTRGARALYLLVERDNKAACALYRAASFVEAHAVHYRRGAT